MEGRSFQPHSPLARFLPAVSLTHSSTLPLHQSTQSLHSLRTKPQLLRLETVLTDCSLVQQSLTPLWKSACMSISGSLQLLETSRQALKHPPERLVSWKTNRQYDLRKLAFAKRNSRSKGNTLFTGSFNAERYWHQSEEAELISEIRKYRRSEVELGDTFKPVQTPPVSKRNLEAQTGSFQCMSDLNRFILKERSRFQHKGTLHRSEVDIPAVSNPSTLQRKQLRQLKPAKAAILKAEPEASKSLQHSQIRRLSEITSGLITDFQASGGYDRNSKVVEEYYKRQRDRKAGQ